MDIKIFYFITFIILIILLISLFYYTYHRLSQLKGDTENIVIEGNKIKLDSLTLKKQKIAQMIVIRADDKEKLDYTGLNIGGIFIDEKKNSELLYKEVIDEFQKKSKIKLFVSTDLEGAWNPFTKFLVFPFFSLINNSKEAYEAGLSEGEALKRTGFNIDFSPVAEFSDSSYGGRTFLGTKEEIKDKLSNYIKGLEKNVRSTCKHYPGKGMIKNLHLRSDKQKITKDDLELFNHCIKNNVSFIMIGHTVVYGELDSKGKPSSVSKEVIESLSGFDGLIISDEINMRGIRNYYTLKSSMYRDLINSGENVILDFYLDRYSINKLLDYLEQEAKEGRISKEKIDNSVRKILETKGYKVA